MFVIRTPEGLVQGIIASTGSVRFTQGEILACKFENKEGAEGYVSFYGISNAEIVPLTKAHRGRPARGFHNPDR